MGEWAREGTTEKVGEFDLDQQVGVTRWASERTPSRKGEQQEQRLRGRQSSSMAGKWGVGVGGRSQEARVAQGQRVGEGLL